jgi:hypothetical protein
MVTVATIVVLKLPLHQLPAMLGITAWMEMSHHVPQVPSVTLVTIKTQTLP